MPKPKILLVLAAIVMAVAAVPRPALAQNQIGVEILASFPPEGKNYLAGPLHVMVKRKPQTEDEANVEVQIFRKLGGQWQWFHSTNYVFTTPSQSSLEDFWTVVKSPGTYGVRAHSYKTGWTDWTPMRTFTTGPVISGSKPKLKPKPKWLKHPKRKYYPKPKPGPPPVRVPRGVQPRTQ